MKPRISSRDVAREAGVSQSTVSLVLNARADARIPEPTRQRVLEAARRLNYSRNASAHALVTGRTHRIGVVPNHPRSFRHHGMYYSDVLAGVVEGALSRNYNLLLHSTYHPDWRALYNDILSGAADGVVLVGHYPEPVLPLALLEARFPMVWVNFHLDVAQPYYAVDCDNEAGGHLAVQHLLSLGHRHIAYVYPEASTPSWIRERQVGAARAIAEAELTSDHLILTDISPWNVPGRDWGADMLAFLQTVSPRPTALFFADESQARHFVETVQIHGVRVPEDFAVVGFNSTELSARTRPPLTSVYQPLLEIGEAAVEMLSEIIEGKPVPCGVRRFPVRLDIRASCGARPLPEREIDSATYL